jgi:myo-inositol-1(or 4)-monophosphatase
MIDSHFLQQTEQIVRQTANRVLQDFFTQTSAEYKPDGSIVTEADVTMQQDLQEQLYTLSNDILMLGEEMSSEQQQTILNSGQPYWCLDPLDGTNNFHHGVPLFAVSLALINNQQVVMGIVYDLVRQELFSASRQQGLSVNGNPWQKPPQPKSLKQSLASIDFKRLDMELKTRLVQAMPVKSQRNIGTCALEWAWLACGRTQLLLHGGEKLWDYAAGSLLLSEAAGISCTLNGETMFNNDLSNRSVVAASNPELHEQWLSFLKPVNAH